MNKITKEKWEKIFKSWESKTIPGFYCLTPANRLVLYTRYLRERDKAKNLEKNFKLN